MDTYADDLAALMNALDLHEAMLVGHSTGGGEVAHYIGRHGTKRVAKAVLIGAVPPQMVKSASNPGGLPMEVFDGIRKNVAENRSQFYKDLAVPFFGFNRPNAKTSQGTIDAFWAQGMMGGVYGQYLCVKEFSEVDYTEDLKKIDVPTLILHGDDDQIVPIDDSARLSAKIVKHAQLKVIPGGSAEGNSGRLAWDVRRQRRPDQCRTARVPESVSAAARRAVAPARPSTFFRNFELAAMLLPYAPPGSTLRRRVLTAYAPACAASDERTRYHQGHRHLEVAGQRKLGRLIAGRGPYLPRSHPDEDNHCRRINHRSRGRADRRRRRTRRDGFANARRRRCAARVAAWRSCAGWRCANSTAVIAATRSACRRTVDAESSRRP
ncbi:chloroperoxidase [Burkholderia territorii]|nr:chloroperoxidase [Burkholderia territorii]